MRWGDGISGWWLLSGEGQDVLTDLGACLCSAHIEIVMFVCVLQEYWSHETEAEGLVEGRSPHMFGSRIYRRTGKGEEQPIIVMLSLIVFHEALAIKVVCFFVHKWSPYSSWSKHFILVDKMDVVKLNVTTCLLYFETYIATGTATFLFFFSCRSLLILGGHSQPLLS